VVWKNSHSNGAYYIAKLPSTLYILKLWKSNSREQSHAAAFSPDLILFARSFFHRNKVFDSMQPQSNNRKYFSCKLKFQEPK